MPSMTFYGHDSQPEAPFDFGAWLASPPRDLRAACDRLVASLGEREALRRILRADQLHGDPDDLDSTRGLIEWWGGFLGYPEILDRLAAAPAGRCA